MKCPTIGFIVDKKNISEFFLLDVYNKERYICTIIYIYLMKSRKVS